MGMHTTILGVLALATAISCFILKQWRLGTGMSLMAATLGLSFLVTIKTLPVDLIGSALVLAFAVGCAMVVNTALKARAPAVEICMRCKKGDRLIPIVHKEPTIMLKLASWVGKIRLGEESGTGGNSKWFCKRCGENI